MLFFVFFKKPGYPTGKPESSLDLHGATLDHISKEKVKGKKFVFQVRVLRKLIEKFIFNIYSFFKVLI